MPGTPFTCVSIAVVVVCSTVCASAPVKLLVICTVGGVIFGYWLIGILMMARVPTINITMEMTIAVTGLLRNMFEDFIMYTRFTMYDLRFPDYRTLIINYQFLIVSDHFFAPGIFRIPEISA